VVAAETPQEALRQFRMAEKHSAWLRVLELRLDYLCSDSERADLLRSLSRRTRLPALIATCRTVRGGGNFKGSIEAEIDILAQAVAADVAGVMWKSKRPRGLSRES